MRRRCTPLLALALALPSAGWAQVSAASPLWQRFEAPAHAARPMLRWWWFGPAVTHDEIDREIRAMRAGGFGGFEVQATYPLSPDDAGSGIGNLPFLSDRFRAALRHAAGRARAEGMRIDVTLGSGWPFGGPHVPLDQAAALIRRVEIVVAAGVTRVTLPAMDAGDRPLAMFLDGRRLSPEAGSPVRVVPAARERRALLFVAGHTGQQVKRAAVGAEGFVIDHAGADAVRNHLSAVGDPLFAAFAGGAPPTAIFSDSLEAYGSSWTRDLPAEFRRRRGYDLLAHLPALFDEGPDSGGVRYDWARTLSELVDERYLRPITDWAHAHGTRFRAQVYGFPPPTLSSNALVDLPEGEGADWRHFTSTRWATSAAHLYDRPVVSSETWTWLHSPSWAATPLDMKVEADRHFLQGINQLIGHGWPYSPPGVPEPGWAFYAAAALSDHNPWYAAMPAVTRYLTRVSAMLREGAPDADIAVYLPTEDAFADLRPARASLNEAIRERLDPALVGQVLDAGHTLDFIDAGAILAGKLRHRALILPAIDRIDPAAYRAIAAWVATGGKVIAIGMPPGRGVGLLGERAGGQEVQAISRGIFASGLARIVAPTGLPATLRTLLPATVALARPDPAIGFTRRRLPAGDLYFVANTGPAAVETRARFAGDNGRGQWWDPVTGERTDAGSGDITVRLAPYGSRLLIFAPAMPAAGAPADDVRPVRDLSAGWRVQARGASVPQLQPGRAWSSVPALRDHSGAVTYTRRLDLKAGDLRDGRLLLDFGTATPLAAGTPARPVAALSAPVREAALVRINGRMAGTVWTAPWRLDVTPFVGPGRNRVEVVVMNTALNALAAHPPATRQLLTLRYGERFQDQDQDKIAPAPSGLLGRVRLFREARGN